VKRIRKCIVGLHLQSRNENLSVNVATRQVACTVWRLSKRVLRARGKR